MAEWFDRGSMAEWFDRGMAEWFDRGMAVLHMSDSSECLWLPAAEAHLAAAGVAAAFLENRTPARTHAHTRTLTRVHVRAATHA